MNWRRVFRLGWRRRSAMILDNAGCPGWLIRWRCPVPRGWGRALEELVRRIDPGLPLDDLPENE